MKDNFSRRVTYRFVVVVWNKRDRYQRIIGKVLLAYHDVCLEQIRAGLAWHYKRYQSEQLATDRLRYARAETEAQEARRGLWAGPSLIPPWEWRRGRRTTEGEPSGVQPPAELQR